MEVCGELVVQSELNTTILFVNLMHPKLVRRDVAKRIAECSNTSQQLLTAALKEISWGNAACEGICKDDKLDARS